MSKLNKKTTDKIESIISEREAVLNSIKAKVNSGNTKVLETLDSVLEAFEETDKKNKEYIAILSVKEAIESLIDEILKAETLEEVEAIRTKLNYQISKVKKVLVKKGETPTDIEDFVEKVKETKNWITEYVRTIKRKANLDIISLANQDELPEEEKNNILKIVRSESGFNKRVNNKLQGIAPKPRVKKEQASELTPVVVETPAEATAEVTTIVEEPTFESQIFELLPFDSSPEPEEEQASELSAITTFTGATERCRTGYVKLEDYSDKKEYWVERYNLEEMAPYDGNFFSRVGSFFKNIPAIVTNRKKLKTMTFDYNVYCGAPALRETIRDVYEETRIRYGLKGVFFGGKLARREAELEDTSYDEIFESKTVESDDTLSGTQQLRKTYSI